MKKIFFLLSLSLVLISCEKTYDLKNLKVDQISFSDCKPSKGITESIEYKTVDKKYLSITHVNSFFNCDPGQLSVDIKIQNDTIVINEDEERGLANCICPYDFRFRIGPMDYGTYNFILTKGGLLYIRFSIDFNSKTDDNFTIAHLDK